MLVKCRLELMGRTININDFIKSYKQVDTNY